MRLSNTYMGSIAVIDALIACFSPLALPAAAELLNSY